GGTDVGATFKPIEGYRAKEADDAFPRYEGRRHSIQYNPRTDTVKLVSTGIGYNYVRFQMELNERAFKVDDGYFPFAKVRDWDGPLIRRKRGMVFVEGTPPAEAVKNLREGGCLRVLGIPRLDLALVSYRVRQARMATPSP